MSARAGVVYLVGAGPGDPGLMTARSLELIAGADSVFYDRLIPPGALAGARDDAELVYVGKRPGVPSVPQEEIGTRLVEAAKAGRSVVRLKGGDPFVFGRGGEEGEALRAAGVEFEVVPGVTAGVAATAYAGIPVTHRDDASAVAFVTGHEDPEKAESALDWDALAGFPGTLVFYMGVKRLAENAAALIAGGRDAGEPAAAIERGTWPGQRTVVATLGTIAAAVEREGIKAPALIVVGAVAARREDLAWLERRPLHGRRVVVTRARAQASGLAATLRDLGAEVVELPAIRIEPRIESEEVRRAVAAIGEYALICVTSPNGAQLLFDALASADGGRRWGLAADSPASTPVPSPGPPSPQSARVRRGRSPSTGSPPTSSPSASSPRRWSRPWPESRSRASACSSPAPPRPATSSPTPCASAAPRSMSSPSMRPCASSPTTTRSRRPRAPTTSPSPPPRP